jgi:hypothetical protein
MVMRLKLLLIAGLFVSTTYTLSAIELSVIIQDGAISADRLQAASEESALKTESGSASWSSLASLDKASVDDVVTTSLTYSSYSGNPAETTLTGSISNTKGSRVFGSGTQFTSELQKGDVVVWGGKEIKVAAVMSDTEFTAKNIVHSWESAYSPSEVLGLYISDEREAVVTSTSLQIPLPQDIHPNWSVSVIGIAKNGSAVTPTLTWDGGGHGASSTSNMTGGGFYGSNWLIDGSAHPDTATATIEFSVDVASRLVLVVWVINGTSTGGGVNSDTDSYMTAGFAKIEPHYLATSTCIINETQSVEPDWNQSNKYKHHWLIPGISTSSFGVLTISSDPGQASTASNYLSFLGGMATYYICGYSTFRGRDDHTSILRRRGWKP